MQQEYTEQTHSSPPALSRTRFPWLRRPGRTHGPPAFLLHPSSFILCPLPPSRSPNLPSSLRRFVAPSLSSFILHLSSFRTPNPQSAIGNPKSPCSPIPVPRLLDPRPSIARSLRVSTPPSAREVLPTGSPRSPASPASPVVAGGPCHRVPKTSCPLEERSVRTSTAVKQRNAACAPNPPVRSRDRASAEKINPKIFSQNEAKKPPWRYQKRRSVGFVPGPTPPFFPTVFDHPNRAHPGRATSSLPRLSAAPPFPIPHSSVLRPSSPAESPIRNRRSRNRLSLRPFTPASPRRFARPGASPRAPDVRAPQSLHRGSPVGTRRCR
jgi:hypothetical protein